MRNVQRYDSLQLVAGAVIDTDGFMRDSPIVARTGVYEYRNPDGTIRREYRPADEVFASDALNSFRGKPITVLHPKKGKITAANAFGTAIGSILSDGYPKTVIRRTRSMLPAISSFSRLIKSASTASCLWVTAAIARRRRACRRTVKHMTQYSGIYA